MPAQGTTKQVKVDNWGVFFLQRLKHFFNRTDYCDLTLQFQGYAQLKVHRLVLNACTEYFELLEKTCNIYDDCLIMPDDLQVDVMVPIINFMYTGQLEYESLLFERLYSTAQIMNMSVLTKLLDAQRAELIGPGTSTPARKDVVIMNAQLTKGGSYVPSPSTSAEPKATPRRLSGRQYRPASSVARSDRVLKFTQAETTAKVIPVVRQLVKPPPKIMRYEKPKPTRYEVPEEFENENLFETSFVDISYESLPLMSNIKREKGESAMKRKNIYDEASCSRKFEELQASTSSYKRQRTDSSEDNKQNIMEQISEYTYQQKMQNDFADQSQSEEDIFDTNNDSTAHDSDSIYNKVIDKQSPNKQSGKNTSTLDHAKIISEVLKKYPHLAKSNKNIKLKIMPGANSSRTAPQSIIFEPKKVRALTSSPKPAFTESDSEWSYGNKSLNQDSVAKLISMGVSNITGPWLCLMCGTPGKALHFPTYNKYYRHLADIHLEKISANICEHCGYKSGKRNHLLHHLYTKHGVPPPSQYSFPKCNQCDYVALTKAFLIKHKLTHVDNREFSCSVCNAFYKTRAALLNHIQTTGHKISPDRKTTNQCVYCNKIFLRETNLYTHLKLSHKELARKDGIIDNSEDDEDMSPKFEETYEYSDSPDTEHVSIKQEFDGKIQIVSANVPPTVKRVQKQPKLLNTQLLNSDILDKVKIVPGTKGPIQRLATLSSENESFHNVASGIATSLGLADRIVMFNDSEYVIQSEHDSGMLVDQQPTVSEESILPDLQEEYYDHSVEVSLPQQTSTSQIMTQRYMKSPLKVPQSVEKHTMSHQVIVSNNQQQFKTLNSSTPVVFTSNVSPTNSAPILSKYLQSHSGNMNLASSTGDTIMVLQDGDLNVDQSLMTTNGSNIVVVYSHPIENTNKQFVQVSQEQLSEQYGETPQTLTETHQLNSDTEMIIAEELSEEAVDNQGWNDGNIEDAHVISKEDVTEEVIDQQDVPMAENESVEITMEQNSSEDAAQDNVQDTGNPAREIVITNEDKVYDGEDVEYGETATEEITNEEQTDGDPESGQLPNAEPIHVVNTVDHEVLSDQVPNNQVVEWSDDDISKEIPQNETHGLSVPQEEHAKEGEIVEESIENIEKEVQKHFMENSEVPNIDSVTEHEDEMVCNEGIPEEVMETEDEPVVESEGELVNQTPEQISASEEPILEAEVLAETNQLTVDEDQATVERDEMEEHSTVEESEADQSLVTEEKIEDVESEDNSETKSLNTKHQSSEKISTLLHDWDDSQPETVSEEQEAEENESTNDGAEHKDTEEVNGKAVSSAPVKAANIEKIVSDWDEEEEK